MGRSSVSRKASRVVCFSHETALQIWKVASVSSHEGKMRPARVRCCPARPATVEDVCSARAYLEDRFSDLSLALPVHVVSSSPSRNMRTNLFAAHTDASSLPRGALVSLGPNVHVASAPYVFVQMASRLPFVELLELGYELCGTYRRGCGGGTVRYQVAPLTSTRQLAQFVQQNPGMKGVKRARRALRYLADGSESPRETKCALLFGLPAALGGYGLGIPKMGHQVECSDEARAIAETRTLRCDLYWPAARLDMEYQSREFHEGELHRIRDSRRVNALRTMGIDVTLVTESELDGLFACDVIAQTARKKLGKKGRKHAFNVHERRLRLRRQLGLPLESRRTFER
ncbi:DUF559 domain-containing protein [Adlercreutzia sp. R21]|uniref:DUF559 domain-containing protein n=1 Tax=Adlercreutzia wanghongyangiae TaxID=3111451 RepID=A0ABU6IFN5_9ACTN|nr:DUF559 domain-containing protein [Adlercreutzia sp. R21]MEC4175241.1 DUF559 domain-containing protein [Adlercreutzia sp. R7]MEC4184435.1 DUF559 domain-containing protein [Adlercreutzia sp. R21]